MENLRELAAIDLNLLVALQALLDEHNVSRAARRIGVSQPAMSRTLARLRDALGDPLLVRQGRSMVPTTRARALAPRLAAALRELRAVVGGPQPFDPEASHRFRIALSDYAGAVLLPRLLAAITERAPQITVETVVLGHWSQVASALATGPIDCALGFGHGVPHGLQSVELFRDDFVCLIRADHPGVRRRLTLRQYTELPHVLVSSRGRVTGVVDIALAERGLERRIAATVPHFLVAPHVVRTTNCIATVARRTAALAPPDLRRLPPPLPVRPFAVVLAWHPTRAGDPAHRWLRELIIACSAHTPSEGGPTQRPH